MSEGLYFTTPANREETIRKNKEIVDKLLSRINEELLLTPEEQKPFIHSQNNSYGDVTITEVDVDINGLLKAQLAKVDKHYASLTDEKLKLGIHKILADFDTADVMEGYVNEIVAFLQPYILAKVAEEKRAREEQYHTYQLALKVTVDNAVTEAVKQERERINDLLDIHENDMGFCEISNHVPFADWQSLRG